MNETVRLRKNALFSSNTNQFVRIYVFGNDAPIIIRTEISTVTESALSRVS